MLEWDHRCFTSAMSCVDDEDAALGAAAVLATAVNREARHSIPSAQLRIQAELTPDLARPILLHAVFPPRFTAQRRWIGGGVMVWLARSYTE